MEHQNHLRKRPKWPSPVSIRVSWAEKEEFERLAAPLPVSRFVKDAILKEGRKPPAPRGGTTIKDREMLAQLLGALGQSRISNNINQLARAANSGSLPVNQEVMNALKEAVMAVHWMRDTLIGALGLKPQKQDEGGGNHDPER